MPLNGEMRVAASMKPPTIEGVVETSLYVTDVARSVQVLLRGAGVRAYRYGRADHGDE